MKDFLYVSYNLRLAYQVRLTEQARLIHKKLFLINFL